MVQDGQTLPADRILIVIPNATRRWITSPVAVFPDLPASGIKMIIRPTASDPCPHSIDGQLIGPQRGRSTRRRLMMAILVAGFGVVSLENASAGNPFTDSLGRLLGKSASPSQSDCDDACDDMGFPWESMDASGGHSAPIPMPKMHPHSAPNQWTPPSPPPSTSPMPMVTPNAGRHEPPSMPPVASPMNESQPRQSIVPDNTAVPMETTPEPIENFQVDTFDTLEDTSQRRSLSDDGSASGGGSNRRVIPSGDVPRVDTPRGDLPSNSIPLPAVEPMPPAEDLLDTPEMPKMATPPAPVPDPSIVPNTEVMPEVDEPQAATPQEQAEPEGLFDAMPKSPSNEMEPSPMAEDLFGPADDGMPDQGDTLFDDPNDSSMPRADGDAQAAESDPFAEAFGQPMPEADNNLPSTENQPQSGDDIDSLFGMPSSDEEQKNVNPNELQDDLDSLFNDTPGVDSMEAPRDDSNGDDPEDVLDSLFNHIPRRFEGQAANLKRLPVAQVRVRTKPQLRPIGQTPRENSDASGGYTARKSSGALGETSSTRVRNRPSSNPPRSIQQVKHQSMQIIDGRWNPRPTK